MNQDDEPPTDGASTGTDSQLASKAWSNTVVRSTIIEYASKTTLTRLGRVNRQTSVLGLRQLLRQVLRQGNQKNADQAPWRKRRKTSAASVYASDMLSVFRPNADACWFNRIPRIRADRRSARRAERAREGGGAARVGGGGVVSHYATLSQCCPTSPDRIGLVAGLGAG